ncbi:type II toxin-antitoxin system HicB family antitoxin [Fenollaria timonensis]|uniref:type II toxin-antitoxin system HicB family antitoxin n=1 Tax=Fenollaria timonensis TaxID=1723384 RepID=UPI00071D4359|nr:type II toxin-antitoxin system HicB family antitoxin [Fenollaria timonensis]
MKIVDHYSYPAIVTYFDNGSTETYFPDFDIYTGSEDDKDLMKYAKELLSVLIEGILDDEEFLPEPSKLQDLTLQDNERTMLVEVFVPSEINIKKNVSVYPCVVRHEDGVYYANFPDFDACFTDAESLDELFVNTKEVLNGLINTIYENDMDVPMPSEADDIKLKSGEFLILVKADLSRNMIENAYIKSDEKYYKDLVKRASDMEK